jgi:hypothetical protein
MIHKWRKTIWNNNTENMRHHQEKFSRQLVDPCSRSTSTLYTISHCLEVRSVTLAYGQSLHVLHSQEDFVMHSCILFVQTDTPCCKCYFSRSDFITMSGCRHEKKDYYKCKVDWLIDWLIDHVDGVRRLRTTATNGPIVYPLGNM